jgi:CRISPR-associated protein Cas1
MKKTIYLSSSGELKRKDNTLFFVDSDEKRKYIPVEDTQEIMVFGELTVNKDLLEFLSKNGIIMHFFNYYGYYTGSYYPREHLNSGHLILMQAQHYLEQPKRMELARTFVKGAVANMLKVLQYYNRRQVDLAEIISSMESLCEKIDNTQSTDELIGIEGNIREYYYKAFDSITGDPEFAFELRTRRPPKNRINALISFANSMVYTSALSEIYKTHLDPRIGYLHTTNFRRFSLNLDVAEIFKPIIADRLIFTLLNKSMITPSDFEDGTEGITLKEKGRNTFVQQFDEKMKTTVKYQSLNKDVSYRMLIRLELYKIEKHLLGEKNYEPLVASW